MELLCHGDCQRTNSVKKVLAGTASSQEVEGSVSLWILDIGFYSLWVSIFFSVFFPYVKESLLVFTMLAVRWWILYHFTIGVSQRMAWNHRDNCSVYREEVLSLHISCGKGTSRAHNTGNLGPCRVALSSGNHMISSLCPVARITKHSNSDAQDRVHEIRTYFGSWQVTDTACALHIWLWHLGAFISLSVEWGSGLCKWCLDFSWESQLNFKTQREFSKAASFLFWQAKA